MGSRGGLAGISSRKEPSVLFLERGGFSEGEGDGAEPCPAVDACAKGQEHSGKVLIPFSLGVVLYHLREELHQGTIEALDSSVCLGVVGRRHNALDIVAGTVGV